MHLQISGVCSGQLLAVSGDLPTTALGPGCATLLVFSLTGPTFAAESITNEALIDGRSQLQGARDHVDLIRIMLKLARSQKESQ